MEEKKKLVFGNNEFVAELWPGNELNTPTVDLEIDAFHTHYDRDYSTETPVKGSYDLSVDEAKKLHAFLEEVIVPVEYEYNIEFADLRAGKVHLFRDTWEPQADWLSRKVSELDEYDRKLLNIGEGGLEYSHRLVKRRKAGEVEGA